MDIPDSERYDDVWKKIVTNALCELMTHWCAVKVRSTKIVLIKSAFISNRRY